jgi:16S rRNA (adenine1518-N6/adenine1519-N6)-dimethyltransferase
VDLLEQTKRICNLHNIKPSRSKGQNFLISKQVYDDIIKAAELSKDDIVLEVGPGLGFLTERLAKRVQQVIAVELENKLVNILRLRMKRLGVRNVEVINENIMKLEIGNWKLENSHIDFKFPITNFKVVANLPYNITSIFLRQYSSSEIKPDLMVLMLQKEVAERIVSKPPKMSLLAVSVQFYSRPEIIQVVLKEAFWPEPKVDSAVIKLEVRSKKFMPKADQPLTKAVKNEKDFFRLVRIGFSARRKMLKNNLAAGYQISQEQASERIKLAGFSEKCRAQDLSLADWIKLHEYFK